jgi:competence protein ComEC
MKRLITLILALTAATAAPSAQTRKALDIYLVDTEGGKATLYVSPSGQTLLIDTGNPGERDTGRIMQVLGEAGVKQIDYLVLTHYHVDHIGGLQEIAKRIPIAHYIDHGPTVEDKEQVAGFQTAYAELRSKAKHSVVKPGDRVPIAGIDFRIVSSAAATLKKALPGGGRPNPACAASQKKEDAPPPDENDQSVGSLITYGQFRAIDLGDLMWNRELELICPNNPVGSVDLYVATHHGISASGAQALVHGVRPRVAVMHNGMRKGGTVQTYQILRSSPGLEDIWQMHWSYNGGVEHNPAGVFIANVDDAATIAGVLTSPPGQRGGAAGSGQAGSPAVPATSPAHTPAHYLKISAEEDGTFTVTNTRNGFKKVYRKKLT